MTLALDNEAVQDEISESPLSFLYSVDVVGGVMGEEAIVHCIA